MGFGNKEVLNGSLIHLERATWGGEWERMIRSVRKILRALLKEQVVCDEVLSTVLTEATNILNSRPLRRNSDHPMDEEPLTANHLLQLRPCTSVPPGISEKKDLHCRRQWRQVQYLADLFRKRWIKEYLPTLQERKKWNEPKLPSHTATDIRKRLAGQTKCLY